MKQYHYPYIVTVYGFDESTKSYTMEYCPFNLDVFIRKNNTKLLFNQRKKIAIQFLKGLKYLHKNGILHRDISYKNILIQRYDDIIIAKISDFGLAKDDRQLITSSDSSLKGTIIDPCLETFKSYDIQNEIYVVGFILWYIFTGKKNFKFTNTAISSIVSKCITSNKEERYLNISELMNDIQKIINIDDAPLVPMGIIEVKNKIINALSDFSANELPDICVSIGLKEGSVQEAFQSKKQYVSKRLHRFDIKGCLNIIDKLKKNLGIHINVISA